VYVTDGETNASIGRGDRLEQMSPEQEMALLDYVASGKGFIPLHCASYCFIRSQPYIDLVGAQFQRHNTGTFRTILAETEHPIMRGFGGFESWDETYVHTKHNEKDRTVLEYRQEGDRKEPWTWVRTHGKGRVFYTAWGHDERTWGNAGFQNLIERGIRWACGQDPTAVAPFALLGATPYEVERTLRKLGSDLKTARLRRNLTSEEAAQKIGTSRFAVADAEKGKPSTSVAVYAALLWAYGLIDRLADLADPDNDEEGTRLALSRGPLRSRHRRKLDNDF
jgi:DNA-binding XRE family transcriptional regulator